MFIPLKLSRIFKYLNYLRFGVQRCHNLPKRNFFEMSTVKTDVIYIMKTAVRKFVSTTKLPDRREIANKTVTQEKKSFIRILWDILFSLVRVILIISIAAALLISYHVSPRAYPRGLIRALEFLGPTFIKLGQWASTRRDLFSEELCDTLTRLQRNASSHSWTYTKFLLSSTFGPKWQNLFPQIDKEPIGSGCCAQVYKAWMNEEEFQIQTNENPHIPFYIHVLEALSMGFIMDYLSTRFPEENVVSDELRITPTVIKVVHPAVENYVETDLFMIELLSTVISYLIPSLAWLDLTGCIKEFSRMMKSQVFEDNFVHCDLHPGNILVQQKDESFRKNSIISSSIIPLAFNSQPRLVILDCGLVSSLEDRCLQNLRNVLLSIALGDGALAGEYIMNHSSHMTHDPMGFKAAIENILRKHMKNRFKLENVNLSEIIKEFYSTIIHYHVQQDSAFINIILSMLVIEGLGRNLDPNNDILREIILFLR